MAKCFWKKECNKTKCKHQNFGEIILEKISQDSANIAQDICNIIQTILTEYFFNNGLLSGLNFFLDLN